MNSLHLGGTGVRRRIAMANEIIGLSIIYAAVFVIFCLETGDGIRRKGAASMALIFLFLLMTVFFIVLGPAVGGVSILIVACTAALALFGLVQFFLCIFRNRGKINRQMAVLLIVSMTVILGFTIGAREGIRNDGVTLDLLYFLQREDAALMRDRLHHLLLNIGLFMPLGFFFLMTFPRDARRLSSAVLFGVFLSTAIEVCQLFLHIGECDINDIFGNGLGTLAGALISEAILRNRRDM